MPAAEEPLQLGAPAFLLRPSSAVPPLRVHCNPSSSSTRNTGEGSATARSCAAAANLVVCGAFTLGASLRRAQRRLPRSSRHQRWGVTSLAQAATFSNDKVADRRPGDFVAWDTQRTSNKQLRIVIVGGGPGGLALASALANTLGNVDIRVLEGRPGGGKGQGAQAARGHTIGLGRRAREALKTIGGEELWKSISDRGMVGGSFTLHVNGVALGLPPPEGEPVVLVSRGEIQAVLREHLNSANLMPNTAVHVQHSTKVHKVDLVARTLTVLRQLDGGGEEQETLSYDLLIGADGVRSRVREAMSSQVPKGRFESELRVLPGRWQVLHMDLPERFDKQGVHAMVSSSAPFGLFCIPNASGPHCVILSWSSTEDPHELLDAKTPEQLEAVLLRYYPGLERVPHDAAANFLKAKPSKAVVSRCRPLHVADHATCVLGDAAHAVGGGSLGQGCSAALQDAAALAECLRKGAELEQALKRQENIRGAAEEGEELCEWHEWDQEALVSSLAAFSEERAAEGWALPDLIELQSAAEVRANALVQSPLVMAFFIEQLGRGTLKPFADIAARLVRARMQSNQQASGGEVDQFLTHLRMRPTMKFTPAVLAYVIERFFLGLWTGVLDSLSRLKPPMQTALMATDESYSALVARNSIWLSLLRAAKAAAGASQISNINHIQCLQSLGEEDRLLWAQQFSYQENLQDDILIRQSSSVDAFFVIDEGECRILRAGQEVGQLGPGDSFGEASLLLQAPSPVTVQASSDVRLLKMPGNVFCELAKRAGPDFQKTLERPARAYGADLASVASEQEEGRSRVRTLLESQRAQTLASEHFPAHLTIDDLLNSTSCEIYAEGDVVALGCERMRLVEDGLCSVVSGGRDVRTLRPGDFFGPDLAPDERVVARSPEVLVCSFTQDAATGLGLLLSNQRGT